MSRIDLCLKTQVGVWCHEFFFSIFNQLLLHLQPTHSLFCILGKGSSESVYHVVSCECKAPLARWGQRASVWSRGCCLPLILSRMWPHKAEYRRHVEPLSGRGEHQWGRSLSAEPNFALIGKLVLIHRDFHMDLRCDDSFETYCLCCVNLRVRSI